MKRRWRITRASSRSIGGRGLTVCSTFPADPIGNTSFSSVPSRPTRRCSSRALIRIAKREPKFNYLGHNGEQFNPLFRGIQTAPDKDQTEQYDKPVVVRVPYDETNSRADSPRPPKRCFTFTPS